MTINTCIVNNSKTKKFLDFIAGLGFFYCSVRCLSDSLECFASCAKWQKIYNESDYFQADTMIEMCQRFPNVPILWSSVIFNTKKSQLVMEMCKQTIKCDEGVTIKLTTDRGRVIWLTLAVKSEDEGILGRFNNNYKTIISAIDKLYCPSSDTCETSFL